MADMNSVLQVEMGGHHSQVICVVIHVVTFADLSGSAMAPTIMGDDAITVLKEEQHLCVPIVGRKWPAMAEHNGLPPTPVLEKDLNAVLSPDYTHFWLRSFQTSQWHWRRHHVMQLHPALELVCCFWDLFAPFVRAVC
jgi:hypothetical protein